MSFNISPRAPIQGGQVYGRLTVTLRVPNQKAENWNCLCSCGGAKAVNATDLRSGKVRSCGCLQREHWETAKTTHGQASRAGATREYKTWLTMKARCENQNNPKFKDYGARGIAICERWQLFDNFFSDMGPKPAPGLTIDRIDNDQGYQPDNCRWATVSEQANNRRSNRKVTIGLETKTLTQWARQFGLNPHTVKCRIYRGHTAHQALGVEE